MISRSPSISYTRKIRGLSFRRVSIFSTINHYQAGKWSSFGTVVVFYLELFRLSQEKVQFNLNYRDYSAFTAYSGTWTTNPCESCSENLSGWYCSLGRNLEMETVRNSINRIKIPCTFFIKNPISSQCASVCVPFSIAPRKQLQIRAQSIWRWFD